MRATATSDAITRLHALIDEEPERVELYEELRAHYRHAGASDAASCVSASIDVLRSDPSKSGRFVSRATRPISRLRAALDDERWMKDLRHPDQDLLVSKIFQTIWPALLALRGKTDRDAGLVPRYEVDPSTSRIELARTFGVAASLLGLDPPRLYLRTDVKGGIMFLPVYPLASLAGSTLLSGFSDAELRFIVGRHLSNYRGEHYIRTLMPALSELEIVLVACLRIADVVPPVAANVDVVAMEICAKLHSVQLDLLRALCRRLVASHEQVDLRRWAHGVELTACRAGLLIANDLATAVRMVRALGAAGPFDLTPHEKIRDLVRFCASEPYFRLRAALGISGRFG